MGLTTGHGLMGMISVQVTASLCLQNKVIMHSFYFFVEQYVHPRVSKIYLANLYLQDEEKWISFLSFLSHIAHTVAPFRSSFPLSIPLSCPLVYSRCRSAFSVILSMSLPACLEIRSTVNLWITCLCCL